MKSASLILFVALILSACNRGSSNSGSNASNAKQNTNSNGYLVVKREPKVVRGVDAPSCNYDKCELFMFTLEHNNATILAHCQTWDVKNRCSAVVVGEHYNFERTENGFLSLAEPHVTLYVEEESLKR